MKLNLRAVDLNLLTIFDALIVEQHLGRAAVKLNMSQPAVSNALARLRVMLDDELFIRSSKGMQPTAKARQLQQPIQQALSMIQSSLSSDSEFAYPTEHYHFNLVMNDYGECVILPQIISMMQQIAPHLTFQTQNIDSEDAERELKSQSVDAAFDYLFMSGDEFVHDTVFQEEVAILASADHKEINGRITLEQYQRIKHVALAPRRAGASPMDLVLGAKAIKRDVAAYVQHYVAMPGIAAHSQLICTLPRRLALHYQDLYPLQVLDTPFDVPPIDVYLIWHKSQENNPAHVWLRRQIMHFGGRL